MALIGHNVYPPKKKAKPKAELKPRHCSWCDYTTPYVWRVVPPPQNLQAVHHYRNRVYCSPKCIGEDFYIGRRFNKRGNFVDIA